MPKPKRRKSTREKLMPFRQQVARIKQYLSNRGISARIGEIVVSLLYITQMDNIRTHAIYESDRMSAIAQFIFEF